MLFEKIDLLSAVAENEVKKVKKIMRNINDSWMIDQATRGMVITVSILLFMLGLHVFFSLLDLNKGPRSIDFVSIYLGGIIISGGFMILRQVFLLRRNVWKKKLTDRLFALHCLMWAVEEYNHLAENVWITMQENKQIEQRVNQRLGYPAPDFEPHEKKMVERMKKRYQLLSEALASFEKQDYFNVQSALHQYKHIA